MIYLNVIVYNAHHKPGTYVQSGTVSFLLLLVNELLLHHVFSDMAKSAVVSTLNWDTAKIYTTACMCSVHSKLARELMVCC